MLYYLVCCEHRFLTKLSLSSSPGTLTLDRRSIIVRRVELIDADSMGLGGSICFLMPKNSLSLRHVIVVVCGLAEVKRLVLLA